MTTINSAEITPPPYKAAGVVTACVLVMYLLTLSPTTSMWDAGEYMAAAFGLGLPHPPGNPFFVLLGRVFALLPIAPTVAQRINVLAALSSAVAAGVWFLIAHKVVATWIADRWMRLGAATAAAIIGATAFTVWHQSVVNEKVYTVALAGLAIISWLIVRWLDAPDGPRADRTLLLIAYLLGLGYANHMAGMLAAPAVIVAVLARRPRILLRGRLIGLSLVSLILGLTPFITQPLRAANHPALNTGEPTGCVERLAVDCTLSAVTLERFRSNANREQYPKVPLLERQASFPEQWGMYWLYFRWQWLGGPQGNAPAQQAIALVFLALGLAGGYAHWRHHRRSFWYFGPLMLTLTLGLIFYLNFKLGYSQAIRFGFPFDPATTEVRDRDYFYLWSFSAWGVWAALGLAWIWRALAGTEPAPARGAPVRAPMRRWLIAAPVMLVALLPLVSNARDASRAGDTFTRDWASDLLNSVEPYGILITNGDNDTFPLWYAQDVEGIRRDVTVAVTSLLGTDWYVRQIIRRPIYEYDAARGPAIYRNTTWPKPTAPPLRMTIDEADSVPSYVLLPGPQQFTHDGISVTITGRVDPNAPAPYLTRDQVMVLRFIRDSFPDRGLFFSGGGYAHELGFGEYILRQGLVDRLVPNPVAQRPGVVNVPGAGFVDPDRTIALWRDVYTAPETLVSRGKWIDVASESIPRHYAGTGVITAEMLARRGDTAGSQAAMAIVRKIVDIVTPAGT
jgi:hypothetical protein